MPKPTRVEKIADSVLLKFSARAGMVATTVVIIPCIGYAAMKIYDKLESLDKGQTELQVSIAKVEGALDKIESNQRIAGDNRDKAISAIDSRVTFLERQGHR